MAFTRINPGDPIHASQIDQLIDALDGASGAGQPIALTALNDASNYALTVQNDDPTNSRALNVLSSSGTTLIKADVTGVTLGSPLNLPTGSVTSAAIANAGVANVDLGPDVGRANLLTNGGFEIWQRGNGPFTTTVTYTSDRWALALTGTDTLSVSRNTANADTANGSVACAACAYTVGSGANSQLQQTLKVSDGYQFTGVPCSISVRCAASAANAARITVIGDGGFTTVNSAFHSGGGSYQTLTASFTCTSTQTYVLIGLQHVASCTAYWDNACLVIGSQPANYVPLHPADDLARCLRYYQRWQPGGANSFLTVNYAYGAANANAAIPLQAVMALTPSLTLSATTDWGYSSGASAVQACTGLTLASNGGSKGPIVATGVTAGGLTLGQAGMFGTMNANSWIGAEANP